MHNMHKMSDFLTEGNFTDAQLEEIRLGVHLSLPVELYAIPIYTAAEMAAYRSFLEASAAYKANKSERYVITETGPEEASYGFKSYYNYEHCPERVCYIPENWDFEDGPGCTGKDFLYICDGDQVKANILFDLCEWEHPCTVLDQWDHEDDLALANIKENNIRKLQSELTAFRNKLAREEDLSSGRPSLMQQISSASARHAAKDTPSFTDSKAFVR